MVARKTVTLVGLLVILLAGSVSAMVERRAPAVPPLSAAKSGIISEPWVITLQGDTTWIQVHPDTSHCPGDPAGGHGGEATGGPDGSETWCFEGGDSCGSNPPWDTRCFTHEDVRALPSQMDINYWHVDTYRTDQRVYCGDYALWCGSDSIWVDGYPVECGSWVPGKCPGYGNLWNCCLELTLPGTFDVAMGCTLMFDPRYDTECKYDYFYVDFWNDSTWVTIAVFNATSNNPGSECGAATGGNPDYWGNTDTDHLLNCAWQQRSDPSLPAFYCVIPPDSLVVVEGPSFRWRFVTDGAWSDADGRGDTDGGAWLDNVMVRGDSDQYTEDFETGVLDPTYWSLPDPDGVIDQWHMVHDPDPPYEGGDGGDQTSCSLDSSFVYRARPEYGYPGGAAWRNGWYYRLITPSIPIGNSGCVVQYDFYECALDYSCDYPAEKVRFYNADYGTWCPWIDMYGYIPPRCWTDYDVTEDISPFYGSSADSMQFAWELMDVSAPADHCRGKHKGTESLVDNVSIGFFDASASVLRARSIDLLQDSFHDSIPGHNSHFDAYDVDTLNHYSGPPYTNPIRKTHQLYLDVSDKDGIREVRLYGSIDGGASWVWVPMIMAVPFDPSEPDLGGEYYATLYPTDFGLSRWSKGTEVWYYVKCEDQDGTPGNYAYFPASADPYGPQSPGGADAYLTSAILPIYPPGFTGVKILLVDGFGRRTFDWAPCLEQSDAEKDLEVIYGETLRDAGYCYDRYDINGAGSNVHIHPLRYTDYDAIVWFTGPYFSNYLFDKEAQRAIRAYLAGGGKVVLCGDRIAYNMVYEGVGEDSLGGEFISGIMGCQYLEEMPSPFSYPYVYMLAEATVNVFGSPVATYLDRLVIYRECPYLKDMSYVVTNTSPPSGYTAQRVMAVTNPTIGAADGVIYTEYQGVGQCVFINFDLSACVNHLKEYCGGAAAKSLRFPPGGLEPGSFEGRVDLLRMILEELLALASAGSGQGGTAGAERPVLQYGWDLAQNVPNPCLGSTRIKYHVGRHAHVNLRIYNTLGQVVRLLEDGVKEAGVYDVHWDGLNDVGQHVSSGLYFYKLEAGPYQATRKMLVIN